MDSPVSFDELKKSLEGKVENPKAMESLEYLEYMKNNEPQSKKNLKYVNGVMGLRIAHTKYFQKIEDDSGAGIDFEHVNNSCTMHYYYLNRDNKLIECFCGVKDISEGESGKELNCQEHDVYARGKVM